MMPHEWFAEHRTEYVTGTLEPDDARAFAAHLPGCEECRRDVARVEEELAWLPMGAPPAPPRPGLRRRIVQHALEGPRRQLPRWLMPAALAASILVLVGVWGSARRDARAMEAALSIERARVVALQDTLSVIREARRVLYTDVAMGEARGALVIFADETTHRWSVVVQGLPPAPAGGRYQFWFITEEGMVRGVEVPPSQRRPMMFTTGMPERGGAVMGAALTVEPDGSTHGPPRGKRLAHLML